MTKRIEGDIYEGYKLVSSFGTMVAIKALGKGTVRKELRGSYTSKTEAIKAIDNFKGRKTKLTSCVDSKEVCDNGTEETA